MMHKVNIGAGFADDKWNRHRGRGKAPEHESAFAADDDEADARRQGDRKCGQDQRRGTLECVLQRKGGAKAAAFHQLEKFGRGFPQRQQQQ